MIIRLLLIVIVSGAGATQAFALHDVNQAAPSTAGDEPLAQCAQVQPVVQQLLDGASARLEAARLTNSAAALRAAVDDLDTALRDLRAQLAPCAKVEPTDAHAGHAMPTVQRAPAVAPGTSAMSPGATTPAPVAVAPNAKPPAGAVDPHAGHLTAPVAKPVPTPPKPSAKPPATAKPTVDPHAGHTMPAAKPTPPAGKPSTSKPPAPAKPPADPHAGHTMPPEPTAAPATAVDPVCGLKVDPVTAPAATHAGQSYYFCSLQHQQLFQKTPTKYLPKK